MNGEDKTNRFNIQVESSIYASIGYCGPERLASYSYQIREVLESGAKSVLEIGPGNGCVTHLMRRAGIHVTTVDHDAAIQPDYVGSVLDLPFAGGSYDLVLCCQVLEHLPWEEFAKVVKDLSDIAKDKVILSLPHHSIYGYIEFRLPRLGKRRLTVDIPVNKRWQFNGEHYWEIGKGVTESQILSSIHRLNLFVEKSFRVPENRYHHFLVLSHSN